MTDYAKINDDGTIANIIVADVDFISKQKGTWIECNAKITHRAGRYDKVKKKFILPKPYPKWTLDKNGIWQPPTPRPEQDPQLYKWDDPSNNWKVIGERAVDN